MRTRDGRVQIFQPEHPRANGKGYVWRSHLVIEASVGRYVLPHEDVHHINEVKDDDRLENLQLLDRSEHMRLHADKRWADGSLDNRGRKNGRAKLSAEDVATIVELLASGTVSQDDLAVRFNVCQKTISLINQGQHWAQRSVVKCGRKRILAA